MSNFERAFGYLRSLLPEKRATHFWMDRRVVLARSAKKVERAADRMGPWPATGVQAVLRANGIAVRQTSDLAGPKWVIEDGDCPVSFAPAVWELLKEPEWVN